VSGVEAIVRRCEPLMREGRMRDAEAVLDEALRTLYPE
jgi:hypothetical protein